MQKGLESVKRAIFDQKKEKLNLSGAGDCEKLEAIRIHLITERKCRLAALLVKKKSNDSDTSLHTLLANVFGELFCLQINSAQKKTS